MTPRFIDREAERRRLTELSETGEARMALLYGRRRVGKSYLLTHAWEDDRALYFTASAVTPEQNRRRLVQEAADWSGEDLDPEDYPTWRTVFRLLLGLRPGRPLVVVLDEFQYFGETEDDLTAVTSELNAAWEGQRGPPRSLLLVLSGSATRVLEALDRGSAPLYGRLAWKARLEPFDYLDAAAMAPFPDLRDRARLYGIFGGLPRYLAPVDPERPLARNAADLALSPRGEVRLQVETAILQEQGLRDVPKYLGILQAIGSGRTELAGIAARAGLDHDTTLRDKVERLADLGYIEKRRNFGAGRTAAWRYRLADPAFTFHHTFVLPMASALEVHDPMDVWEAHVAPRLATYMGHQFERIAEQACYRIAPSHGMPLVREWGRWEGTDRQQESLEMDVVTRLTDGAMMTGSIKWSRRPVGPSVHLDHMRDLDRLARSGQRWAHEAMEPGSSLLYVSAGGFEPEFRARAEDAGLPVICLQLEDMYGEEAAGA